MDNWELSVGYGSEIYRIIWNYPMIYIAITKTCNVLLKRGKNAMTTFTLIISIATPLTTLIGVFWAIYQYIKEATRKKRSETLKVYNELFDATYEVREAYYKKTTNFYFPLIKYVPTQNCINKL
jgi:hypothetical protein